MIKRIALVSSVVMFTSFTSTAFAADSTLGFQFRVPFTVTTDANIKNSSANSILLSFFVDQDTEIGILSEHYAFTDTTGGLAVAASYDVNALRVSKNLAIAPIPVYVGLDLGQMSILVGTVPGATPMADLFGGVKLLSSKGKVTSFLGVEVAYRMARAELAGTGIRNYGGVGLNLSAGVNF
jgi:hypothetical protein